MDRNPIGLLPLFGQSAIEVDRIGFEMAGMAAMPEKQFRVHRTISLWGQLR